ncbi:MAG: NADPH-dependent 7-cyano-7-deazaguanine reductase [Coxiella sp. DG_40]|nr:MAG: NADPH-dependent 7-cyano-7-deazaguanine reductase [Coxiella sp. DG_40]
MSLYHKNTSVALEDIPLGKKSTYVSQYSPDLLFSIPRELKRELIGVSSPLPFKGCDIWNAFELSWLNARGRPIVALGEFLFPCESPNIIESKSLKLYLNSFNNTKFDSLNKVQETIKRDLSVALNYPVKIKIISTTDFRVREKSVFSGICIDDFDVACNVYTVEPKFLHISNKKIVSEILYSELLKSNCPVTGQPDWGSVQISYTGQQIDHQGLLKYIISFRNHDEFHEQCVERMFVDIMQKCSPEKLTIYARYVRRGGLDINPYRSTEGGGVPKNVCLVRQ